MDIPFNKITINLLQHCNYRNNYRNNGASSEIYPVFMQEKKKSVQETLEESRTIRLYA